MGSETVPVKSARGRSSHFICWRFGKNRRSEKRIVQELKGTGTTLEVKKYFFEKAKDVKFGIYSITLNKKRVFERLAKDKARSRKTGAERISEGVLFFMATMFGSVGVYAGMFAFRHKTRKWYFVIGIPMLIVENSAFLYLIYLYR